MHLKTKHIYTIFLIVLIYSAVKGQKMEHDSLLEVFHSVSESDEARTKALVALGATNFRRQYPDSLVKLQTKSRDLLETHGTVSDRITVANHQGLALYYLDDYWKSIEVLSDGERLAREVKDTVRLVKILNGKATCYLELSNFSSSIEELTDALSLAEQANLETMTPVLYSNLGLNYLHFKKYEKARIYFENNYSASKENENYRGMIYAATNIGVSYFEQESYEESLEHHLRAHELVLQHDAREVAGTVLLNIGECYFELGNTAKAKHYNLLALETAKLQEEQPAIIRGAIHLAHIYQSENSIDSAFHYANYAFPLAKKLDNKVILEAAADILYQLFEEEGNYQKALETYKFKQSVTDSIASMENRQILLAKEVEQKYQEEKLTAKLAFEQAIVEQKLKSQSRFYLLLMAFLLIGGIAIIIERNKRSQRKHKRDQLLNRVEVLRERVATRSLYSSSPEKKFELDKEAIEQHIGSTIGVSSWKILNAIYKEPTIKNSEIAEQIHLSVEGVSSSLRRMYKKFDLQSKDTRNLKISLIAKAVKLSLGEEQ